MGFFVYKTLYKHMKDTSNDWSDKRSDLPGCKFIFIVAVLWILAAIVGVCIGKFLL